MNMQYKETHLAGLIWLQAISMAKLPLTSGEEGDSFC